MIETSVIIATYNRAGSLLRTLGSLARQNEEPGRFEIVVANNNSTDGTEQACRDFAGAHPELNLTVVFEPQQGLSPARNAGIAASRGRYLAVIDDDEEVNPGFVKAYRTFFETHPGFAAAGGKIIPRYESPLPQWYTPYAERPIAGPLDLGDTVREMPSGRYPGGGNMAIRRTAVEHYGAFDPRLGRTGSNPMGGEEKDLFARLRAGGGRIGYVPGAVIYHIIPASKLTPEYFKRLTRMTGVSERLRSRSEGTYGRRLCAEAVKWGGTLALAAGYLLRGTPAKGAYLIRMRWEISRGLLGG